MNYFGLVWCLLWSLSCICQDSLSTGIIIDKDENSIYIASYNVYKLGDIAQKYKDIDDGLTPHSYDIADRVKNSANLLAAGDFDIITLQEVKDGPGGVAAVLDLVEALQTDHQQHFEVVISDRIGRGLFFETIAFLYKPDRVELVPINGQTTALIESSNPRNRKFAKTQWKAGDFDFTLISCHFSFISNDPSRRQADYIKLEEILENPTAYSVDPDIIVVGDFNRFGSAKRGEYGVYEMEADPNVWRAPNVTCFDPQFNKIREVKSANISHLNVPHSNPQYLSTTCAKNSKVYDIFFFTSDVSEEFPSGHNEEVYGRDWGIFQFDEVGGVGYVEGMERQTNEAVKHAYSDHRPIWMRFRTNAGEFDGVMN